MQKKEEDLKKAIKNIDIILEKQLAEADASGNYAINLLKKRHKSPKMNDK